MTPKTKAAAAGLDRRVRHRCWGHPSSRGMPLPSRSSSSLFSLAAIPLGLQKHPPNNGSAGQALVSWISVDLSVKVPRTVSDPGSCLSNLSSSSALRRHRTSAPGDGSQWKQGPRARHGNSHPGRAGRNVRASLGLRTSITHRWQPPAVPCPRGCKQTGSPWS